MKSAILASVFGLAAAQQVDLDYFNDPFTAPQFISTAQQPEGFGPETFTAPQVTDTTDDGFQFFRDMTLEIPDGAPITIFPATAVGIVNGEFTMNANNALTAAESVLDYSFNDPLDISGFDHFKMLLQEADAMYNLTLTYCSGAGTICSSFKVEGNPIAAGDEVATIFPRDMFIGNAEISAVDRFVITLSVPALADVTIGILTTIYFSCSEQALQMAIGGAQEVTEGCYYGEGIFQNAFEECEVCCVGEQVVNTCVNFTCTEPPIGQPGTWVGEKTCEAVVQGDPHLTGFNGEKMDIAHDASFKNGQLLNLFCSEETSFFAELASTESGNVYITSVFGKYEGLAFSMNIFNEVRVSTDLTYVDDADRKHFVAGQSQITVASDGASLSSDDGKVKIIVAARAQNGVDYLDVQLSSLAGRYPASGMLGQTLNNKVSDADFNDYSEFVVSVDELATFSCQL